MGQGDSLVVRERIRLWEQQQQTHHHHPHSKMGLSSWRLVLVEPQAHRDVGPMVVWPASNHSAHSMPPPQQQWTQLGSGAGQAPSLTMATMHPGTHTTTPWPLCRPSSPHHHITTSSTSPPPSPRPAPSPPAGIKTRFKYREVAPSTYGMSIEDILMHDDKELNQVGG